MDVARQIQIRGMIKMPTLKELIGKTRTLAELKAEDTHYWGDPNQNIPKLRRNAKKSPDALMELFAVKSARTTKVFRSPPKVDPIPYFIGELEVSKEDYEEFMESWKK